MEVGDHDSRWPALYEEEAARLRPALGAMLRAMEHVGSTAVPGLAAKPILDIMAAVGGLEEAPLPTLGALGYILVPTGMKDRLLLQKAGPPAINLHLVTLASWPGRKERRFRDRLLAHPEEAAAYGALKRDLALRFHDDIEGSTRVKTGLIQEIMDRTHDEAGLPRESVWED